MVTQKEAAPARASVQPAAAGGCDPAQTDAETRRHTKIHTYRNTNIRTQEKLRIAFFEIGKSHVGANPL